MKKLTGPNQPEILGEVHSNNFNLNLQSQARVHFFLNKANNYFFEHFVKLLTSYLTQN